MALMLFGNSDLIGRALGDAPGEFRITLLLALCGFFLLDFSVQAVQGPLRALLTDVVPEEQMAEGNAYFARAVGLGNLIGSFMGAEALSKLFPFFESDLQALFFIAALLLCTTVALCCLVIHEKPLDPLSRSQSDEAMVQEEDLAIRKLLRTAPRPFWQVFVVQCFTWYGFFTLFVYASVWVGENVYRGDGRRPVGSIERTDYDKGVQLANIGLSINAAVTVLYSSVLPRLIDRLGIRAMYFLSMVTEASLLSTCIFLRGPAQGEPSLSLKLLTLASLGLMGISWASTMTIPWALMGTAVQRKYPERIGLLSTFFNLSQSGPQLFVSLGSPIIVRLTGNVSVVMLLGGIVAAIGAFLVFALRVDVIEGEEFHDFLDESDFREGSPFLEHSETRKEHGSGVVHERR